jgi:tetratricopeptide (TPR) repeat protein
VRTSFACAPSALAAALVLAGCATGPARSPTTPSAPPAGPASVETLAAAIADDAARSEHPASSEIRNELAAAATRDAQACIALAPHAAACLYGQAVALGLAARAHPSHASSDLNEMLQALASAELADPNYDHGGPARVRALVLTRAPGWPLGPGDPEAAVVAARRAVGLEPQYPPNLLALAAAQEKAGDNPGARESFTQALAAAQALPPNSDRDGWLREAQQGLGHR